ncbi:type II secretion system protein H [Anaerohalosphaera lusitana]|uniref:Type II secretion system protein H n=1 Tax=Anaerohalosphaera lusitana TaxID=1936003 RepID=A0A1U9NPC6_9BACT|nr:hypothetical protein [Anaerohalosphaera lusitana]AQT69771.1 type II secretion system protein H [Anaerohalosphaera lusitana]
MTAMRIKSGRELEAGYTLAEVIVVVMFIGIFAAVAIPRIDFGIVRKHAAETAAHKIVTDLRRTRHMAISNASENSQGYRMDFVSVDGRAGYRLIDLSNNSKVDEQFVSDEISCSGAGSYDFGPLGNLKAGSDDSLEVAADGKTFSVAIVRSTGAVKCTEE